jgi:multidrug transporter EmrE-like cation transporter
MLTYQSLFSLFATATYLLVAGLCAQAFVTGRRLDQMNRQSLWWAVFAVLFVLLAALRLSGLEEYVRNETRSILRKDGIYEMRRDVQAPLSVIAILCCTALVALMVRSHLRMRVGTPYRIIAYARFAAACLCGLVVLRVISFHAIDALLYGPLKLNWVIDIGSSLVIGLCAYRFGRIRQLPRSRR